MAVLKLLISFTADGFVIKCERHSQDPPRQEEMSLGLNYLLKYITQYKCDY